MTPHDSMIDPAGRVAGSDAILLPPSRPRVVMGMAHNNQPDGVGKPPQAFHKSARTVIAAGQPIIHDTELGALQVETELAIVFGRRARRVSAAEALSVISGVTVGNDVTAIRQNPHDNLLTQSKNGDGFTPLGPWLVTDLPDLDRLESRIFVDGIEVARGSTADLVYTIAEQIAYVTQYVTFDEGDVLLAGCPRVWAPAVAGQTVRCEIDGIGALENPIIARSADND